MSEVFERSMAELSLSSVSKKQVIIVCYYPYSSSDKQYEIYVLNLDDFGDKPIRTYGVQCLTPVFDLDFTYPSAAAFAVSDSNFYMIGGYIHEENKWIDEVYSYPMKDVQQQQLKTTTATLEKGALTQGPHMKGKKFAPEAVPIGGGSFCVFSTLLFNPYPIHEYHFPNPCNFEVFDSAKNSWYQLPEPFSYNKVSSQIQVESFAFDHESSNFIISVDSFGVFVLCLAKPVKEWMPLLLPHDNYIDTLPFMGNGVIIDRMCFAPCDAYDTSDFQDPFPLFDPDESCSYQEMIRPAHYSGSNICYLGGKNKQICIAIAGFPLLDKCWDTQENTTPYLQVYVADVAGAMDLLQEEANYDLKFRTSRYLLPSACAHMVQVQCLFPLSN